MPARANSASKSTSRLSVEEPLQPLRQQAAMDLVRPLPLPATEEHLKLRRRLRRPDPQGPPNAVRLVMGNHNARVLNHPCRLEAAANIPMDKHSARLLLPSQPLCRLLRQRPSQLLSQFPLRRPRHRRSAERSRTGSHNATRRILDPSQTTLRISSSGFSTECSASLPVPLLLQCGTSLTIRP